MTEYSIDAKKMQCPKPIMEIFKTMKKANVGDVIKVEATDRGFLPDVKAWCMKTGNELVTSSELKGTYKAVIRKK